MTMNQYKFWTDDEIKILKLLYPNAPREEICKKIHRSWKGILTKGEKLGLKRELNKWTDEDMKIAKKKYLEGVNIHTIAAELKRTPNAVRQKMYLSIVRRDNNNNNKNSLDISNIENHMF